MKIAMYINVGTVMIAMGMLFLASSLFGRVLLDEPAFLFAAFPAILLIFGPLLGDFDEAGQCEIDYDPAMVDAEPKTRKEEKPFLIKDRYGLTEREEEIMVLLARGLSRNAIGERLYLSRNTVDTHIRSLYLKLDCHKKDEIIRLLEEGTG